MKRRIIHTLFALSLSLAGFGQKTAGFNIELGLVQNYNGFFKLFNGVLDAGAGYNMEFVNNLYGGAEFRMTFLGRHGTTNRTTIYKPGLNLLYYLHLSDHLALVPSASMAYALLSISNKEYAYREMQSGWNPGAGLKVLWKRENKLDYYVFGRFDYIYLNKDNDFTHLEYYREMMLTSFGLGLRIKQ